MTDEVYNHNNVTALKRDMGKKKEQIRNSMADIGKEMNQSFRGHSRLFGDTEYIYQLYESLRRCISN
jgi:hypothetical protein